MGEESCQPHLFAPLTEELGWMSPGATRERPLRNWVKAKIAQKQAPEWPRFHPLPTHPAFAPAPPMGDESQIIYGRFGKMELAPTPDQASNVPASTSR